MHTSADTVSAPVLNPRADAVLARRRGAVREITSRGLLTDEMPVCAVFDLDTLDELVASLDAAYPRDISVLHTIAAKSISLKPMLEYIAELGLGCEVASPGELQLAIAAGFSPDRIIYDSPAKTASDIAEAFELGVTFNIDNFEELARVDNFLSTWEGDIPRIGIRINPQSGAGSIEAMSTATATSKFGIGLVDARVELIDTFVSRPWLRQIHVHSGSQGVPLSHTVTDIAAIVELAESVESVAGEQRIDVVDIGGGLSVNFDSDETTPTFQDHASALRRAAPVLFSGKYSLVTEFGRSLTAKAGTLLGKVEYVKQAGPRAIAITHVGVHVATRTVFMPEAWPLRVEVFCSDGTPREGAPQFYDVAGPACFTGDVIATKRLLPKIMSGDVIAVPDTGGYYVSNHFGYNSLPRPSVYAIRNGNAVASLYIVRRAQTLSEIILESGETSLTLVS